MNQIKDCPIRAFSAVEKRRPIKVKGARTNIQNPLLEL